MTLHDFASSAHKTSNKGRKRRSWPISPLEGEMSGRTEGGGSNTFSDHDFAETKTPPSVTLVTSPPQGGRSKPTLGYTPFSSAAQSSDADDALPGAPSKITGSRHLAAALGYSLGGAARLLRETAFRHELLAAIAIFGAFAFVGASLSDYVSMAVLFLALIAAEALNTAIEEIIDRISPEWSKTGKNAKDLGSFAVLCLLTANGLMAAFVIGSKLLSP